MVPTSDRRKPAEKLDGLLKRSIERPLQRIAVLEQRVEALENQRQKDSHNSSNLHAGDELG